MAVVLGKRKRRADIRKDEPEISDGHSENEEEMRARFKRAFEAKFAALPEVASQEPEDESEDKDELEDGSDDFESDWSGLSGSEDDNAEEIETVDYSAQQLLNGQHDRREEKAFMSWKPPTSQPQTKPQQSKKPQADSDENPDADDLKNDLALQRLLKESHLLDQNNVHNSSMAPEGKGRLKALDMRLQDLGAKESHLKQDKMPMWHRKGMVAKAAVREDKRRKEAAENGIILERARKNEDRLKPKAKRERGVGGPNVGRFKSGTLKLSSSDLRDINGPKGRGGNGKGKGRKR